MPNYQNGKIYKIYNIDEPEKFYVGSTTQELWHRLRKHKSKSKIEKSFFFQEVNSLGWNKFKIELIHNFPCNDKPELFAEEERVRSITDAYYNSRRAFLNEEKRNELKKLYNNEYAQKHKEEIKQYGAQYYQDHKEKTKKRTAKYYEHLKEYKKQYWKDHKKEIADYDKIYRAEHQAELKEKRRKRGIYYQKFLSENDQFLLKTFETISI